jgi:hypothetical protein
LRCDSGSALGIALTRLGAVYTSMTGGVDGAR